MGSRATRRRRDGVTLQAANIARDGRHMVTPCGFSDVQRCKPHWTAKGEARAAGGRRKPGSGGSGAGCRRRTARKEMDGPHETCYNTEGR